MGAESGFRLRAAMNGPSARLYAFQETGSDFIAFDRSGWDKISLFFAKALPEWDFRYLSNSSALYLSGKAEYQINSQGMNLAVWLDFPEL